MKKIYLLFIAVGTLVSCGENGEENERVLSDSSGNINNLSVIVDNDLWQGEVGEAIRENLASPVDGLPQDEPLFSISQMPPEAFSGFTRKNRIFLKIEKGQAGDIKVGNNLYAKPQTGVVVKGQTNEEIASLINQNAENIIKAFKRTEINEKQRRISKSLKEDERLKQELGVSLKFPDAYRYAKDEEGFFWIRKDIPNGSMEIMVYEVPLNTIQRDSNIVGNIIKMRDSIGEQHIPGPVDGSYMITEAAYAPYLFNSEIDNKFAYETKGTWEVNDAYMGGPFLNYAVLDEENNRFVILEGFAFAPSARKRDNMFELEAILKSAKIK
ncbi:DUF4837 family protein [Salinimicrobium sp. GXAS 041]|uniref:DUF4837 family protein n=1 Tax=Salinimicrobium sp. GXAS 041 TaxID=3400806 RepID=UPI003C7909ED